MIVIFIKIKKQDTNMFNQTIGGLYLAASFIQVI